MCKSLRTVSGTEQEPCELGLLKNKPSQCHPHHFLKSPFGLFPLEPSSLCAETLRRKQNETLPHHFPWWCCKPSNFKISFSQSDQWPLSPFPSIYSWTHSWKHSFFHLNHFPKIALSSINCLSPNSAELLQSSI